MSVAELGRSESAAAPPASVSAPASTSTSTRSPRRAGGQGAQETGDGHEVRLTPGARGTARSAGGGRYSIPSGPCDSPERNWRTNGFSELNRSSAGPDCTIRPFHSTEMCSATRRALMMSWVMTT